MNKSNSFSSNQISMTKRQASMIMASMLLFCLFVFIVGFFLGKRVVVEDFSSQITQKALHDQIDFLLTTQSLKSSQGDQIDAIQIDDHAKENSLPEFIENEKIVELIVDQNNNNDDLLIKNSENNEVEEKKQYAQLIGFGTKKAAQAFVARLKKHDITIIVNTMVSKTAAGKQKVWYQAVTPVYNSSQLLKHQIEKIKRLEHIRDKDIKIVYAK